MNPENGVWGELGSMGEADACELPSGICTLDWCQNRAGRFFPPRVHRLARQLQNLGSKSIVEPEVIRIQSVG